MSENISLEMGLTLKVFHDTLPNATIPYSIQAQASGYTLDHDGMNVAIELEEKPPRVIAGLSLPVTQVEIKFTNHSAEQIEQFMDRFMKYFHRGGG